MSNSGTISPDLSVILALPESVPPATFLTTQWGVDLTGTDGPDQLQGPGDWPPTTLAGGLGDDTYLVTSLFDIVSEGAAAGVDTVVSRVSSYVLPADVENLRVEARRGYGGGNALDNRITGDDQAQILNGGGGNDLLTGGGGADVFQMLAGGGWDVITDFEAGVDRLHLAAFPGFGTAAAMLAALRQDGAHVHLDLGGGQGATFLDRSVADFSATDFILPPDPAGMTLSFADEFDSFVWSADGSQGWRTTYATGDRTLSSNSEGQYYSDASVGTDPFRVEDGVLVITASPEVNAGGLPYTSGLITSQGMFAQRYGYFEARLLLPAGAGWWPAFWMLPSNGDWPPELDILESFGRGDGMISFGAHTNNGAFPGAQNISLPFDAIASNYHTYAASWLPDGIRFYLDGVEVASLPTPTDMSRPMHLLLNLAVSNAEWAAGATAEMRIDYVRAYAYSDERIAAHAETLHTLTSATDATLPDTLHTLVLTGTGSLTGIGNAYDNRLFAGTGGALLLGLGGNDHLIGNTGNDTLDGGAGADFMEGGAGDDTYVVDHASDRVRELPGDGLDTVRSSVNHTLRNNVENLVLTGSATAGTGNDLANLLTAGSVAARLSGLGGDDTLIGGAGNDTLDGGIGADTMIGGTGNDTYFVHDAGDLIIEMPGEGTDVVRSGISYALGDHLETLVLTGAANINGTGNALANDMIGNAGNNRLEGGDGNDTLDGGAGADTLIGGAGNDTYLVDDAGDLIIEMPGEGTDVVRSGISYVLGDHLETLVLTGTANINGTGNALANNMVGNAGNNRLEGGDGNDTLIGAAGADTMIGGTGNDTYIVDHAGDRIVERAGEGTDAVSISVNYTLGDHLENLSLTGSASAGGGNELANRIIANNVGARLHGHGGNDTLIGGAGNDTLDGGAGADSMTGGAGNDTYIVDHAGDRITELAVGGIDSVQSSISYTLDDHLEHLVLNGTADLNGTGNALANRLLGNAGNNRLEGGDGADTLIGGAGNDTMIGGTGNDTYIVDHAGDMVIEQAGEGVDAVQSSVDYTLGAHLETMSLTGSAAIGGGNALANRIIAGGVAARLFGHGGDDTLIGGAGNDTLDGGQGADHMTGGAGDDVFVFAPGCGADVVTDFGRGRDLLDLTAFGDQLGSMTATGMGGNTLLRFAEGGSILLLGVPSVTLEGGYVIA